MGKLRILALLGLCIAGLILVGAGWENLPVKEIKIEGNRKIEKQAIFYKIRTNVGKPFQSKQIEEDIKAIYNIGYFENIEIDVQKNRRWSFGNLPSYRKTLNKKNNLSWKQKNPLRNPSGKNRYKYG